MGTLINLQTVRNASRDAAAMMRRQIEQPRRYLIARLGEDCRWYLLDGYENLDEERANLHVDYLLQEKPHPHTLGYAHFPYSPGKMEEVLVHECIERTKPVVEP